MRLDVRDLTGFLGVLADGIVIAAVAAGLLSLVWRNLVITAPAAVVLFPVGVAMAVWTWSVLRAAGRPAVRAGADVVASVMLGAVLVLFAVWLGNVTGLPGPEAAGVRRTLTLIGGSADPPWWVWAAAFALLAASVLRRAAGAVHVTLLLVVLVGVVAPPALGQSVRERLRIRYMVAYQRDFAARAEAAAYEKICHEVAAAGPRERAAMRRPPTAYGPGRQVARPSEPFPA